MTLLQADRQRDRVSESSPPPPDVTIVTQDLGAVGGMEHQLAELVIGLRRLGHAVTVIARTCELPAGVDVAFHRVRGPRRPSLLGYPWFLAAASLILWRARRGVVQSTGAIVLNRVDVIAVHYCHQVGPAHPSRSTRLFRLHARLIEQMTRSIERLCFRINISAHYACVSEGVADEVRHSFPELADRVVTIHNGVDAERFAPGVRRREAGELRRALGIPADRLVAAFVGSEWERKGLEPVIRALALAPGWQLVVAGAGDRDRYEALARSLDVDRAVSWLGVSRDIQQVYELADALVFPTSYEAFSLVSLEAAASGLPILATPVNGMRELVTDGESGFLISRDPRVIAERLVELAADAPLRERMGEAAREAALAFSWDAMVAKHHELYARLTAPRAADGAAGG